MKVLLDGYVQNWSHGCGVRAQAPGCAELSDTHQNTAPTKATGGTERHTSLPNYNKHTRSENRWRLQLAPTLSPKQAEGKGRERAGNTNLQGSRRSGPSLLRFSPESGTLTKLHGRLDQTYDGEDHRTQDTRHSRHERTT
jgi:hypothetical protein